MASLTDASQTFVVYGLVGLSGCALVWLLSPAMRRFDVKEIPPEHELAGSAATGGRSR